MSAFDETPRGNRIRLAFFGLRNAGKSTLVNAFTGQDLAIVSPTPGTTTDPVSKAMEILPLGPCLVTDTAGLDDEGALGAQRVEKSLAVLAATDIAVWVASTPEDVSSPQKVRFLERCDALGVKVLTYHRGEDVVAFRQRVAAIKIAPSDPPLLEGLVAAGDRVICVCPIDESAPRGRLILPQVQVIRACLDLHATCSVCQPAELAALLDGKPALVVTDSQAFAAVRKTFDAAGALAAQVRLTSFSILFARQKGDLVAFCRGLAALETIPQGSVVLIAEGCTHHRQCNDIGATKIPKALERLTGKKFSFVFASGPSFALPDNVALVVHCGGCMLTRREVLARLAQDDAANVPVLNYGILLAAACGIRPDPRTALVI